MDERNIMENILLTTKGVCDLYLHGTIESTTQNVRNAFKNALTGALDMQEDIYREMSDKGWYSPQQAQSQQVQQFKQKFSGSSQG